MLGPIASGLVASGFISATMLAAGTAEARSSQSSRAADASAMDAPDATPESAPESAQDRLQRSHVRAIAQDAKGHLWFGTDGEGLARYDGTALTFFTENEGLPSNFVRAVQVDAEGTLWITSRDGLCTFDGTAFKRITIPREAPSGDESFTARPPGPDALWFAADDGVCVYDGRSLRYLPMPLDPADAKMRREQPGYRPTIYGVYSILTHRDGSIWIGTEARGVCRWDGVNFSWIRGEDIEKAAIRSMCQDSKGDVWLGNSGVGLFRYHDGKLTNFGVERGIDNRSWLTDRMVPMKGRIADPHAILEDRHGILWIGAYDSGVYRYDGKDMTNYTTADGLPTDTISSIFEDASGTLWIGTFSGVCRLEGTRFRRIVESSAPKP